MACLSPVNGYKNGSIREPDASCARIRIALIRRVMRPVNQSARKQ